MPSQQQRPLSHPANAHGTGIALESNNCRSSAPSRQMAPPVSFYNHQNLPFLYVPGTRMINIPPPTNYPTVDGIARPPSPYVNRHASMPMPPLMGFGTPFGKPVIGRTPLQPKLAVGSTTSPGHRRNRTTVSSSPEIVSPTATRSRAAILREVNKQTGANALTPMAKEKEFPDRGKPTLLKPKSELVDAVTSGNKYQAMSEASISMVDDPHTLHASKSSLECDYLSYHDEEPAMNVQSPTYDRSSSRNSGSTVASESWNVMDSTMLLEKDLLMNCLQPTPEQKTYPLNEYMQGSPQHDIKVYDFAYASGPPTTIPSSSHSDYVPSVNLKAASDSSASSSRMLIDLGEYKEPQDEGSAVQSIDEAFASKSNDAFLLPATTYSPLTAAKNESSDSNEDDDPFMSTSRERLIPPKNRDRTQQVLKKYNPSVPLEVLNRASDSLSNVAAAHTGMTPVHNTDTIDYGFSFPTRGAEQRFSSVPNLRSQPMKEPEASRHSKSFSRLLEGFGSKVKGAKKAADTGKSDEVADPYKSHDSLARRISTRLSDFIIRKGW